MIETFLVTFESGKTLFQYFHLFQHWSISTQDCQDVWIPIWRLLCVQQPLSLSLSAQLHGSLWKSWDRQSSRRWRGRWRALSLLLHDFAIFKRIHAPSVVWKSSQNYPKGLLMLSQSCPKDVSKLSQVEGILPLTAWLCNLYKDTHLSPGESHILRIKQSSRPRPRGVTGAQ